jgi:hypothetical protein
VCGELPLSLLYKIVCLDPSVFRADLTAPCSIEISGLRGGGGVHNLGTFTPLCLNGLVLHSFLSKEILLLFWIHSFLANEHLPLKVITFAVHIRISYTQGYGIVQCTVFTSQIF